MVFLRSVAFSCELFGGYTAQVDLDLADSLEDVVRDAVRHLDDFLKAHRLEQLRHRLQVMATLYHMHDVTFEDMLLREQTFYICGHDV